jgi:hypothetical protein
MEINDRKKAKQAYLESLARQKEAIQPTFQDQAQTALFKGENNAENKQSKREKLLEEKRRAFFQLNQPSSSGSTSIAPNPIEQQVLLAQNTPILNPVPALMVAPQLPRPMEPALSSYNRIEYQEDPRLSDWKKLGHPSEFSYAKFLGILDKSPQVTLANCLRRINRFGYQNKTV